jgi:phenylacetate-CoA ligase
VTILEPRVTPLIRYKLGDLSMWLEGNCRCGCNFPRITRPIGRSAQLVRLPSGRTLSAFGFMFVLRDYAEIRRFRVIQERHDGFRVLLVPRRAAGDLPFAELRSRLESVIGEPVRFTFEVVDALDEKTFKRTHFVSRLAERE